MYSVEQHCNCSFHSTTSVIEASDGAYDRFRAPESVAECGRGRKRTAPLALLYYATRLVVVVPMYIPTLLLPLEHML